MHPNPRLMARALLDNDYFRRPLPSPSRAPGHKEWLHFTVHTGGLDVLVNFSIVDDVVQPGSRPIELSRITALVRNRSWDGDIDYYPRDAVQVRGGHLDVHLGDNFVRYVDDHLELHARMRQRPIEIDLRLWPEVMPNQANTLQVPGCPGVHWVAVPRMRAAGRIRLSGESHSFDGALAYHDHNWGEWRWGQNFAWEWGYGVPRAKADPWSLIYVRLTDRSHTSTLAQSVFLWRGAHPHRFFRPDELRVEHEGLLAPKRVFRLPRVMALAHPEVTTDIPQRLHVTARGISDTLDITFTAQDVAQVILPNDDDLGVTTINEVTGHLLVEGRVDGERIKFESSSIFEFLSD